MSDVLLNIAMGMVLIRYTILAVEGIVRVLDWITTPREPRPQRVHRAAPAPKFKAKIYGYKDPLI